jgi:nucleoside-diphosphate-sugar epimerase
MMDAPGIDGDTIDLGSGTLTSIREIAEMTVRMVNPDITPEFGALEDRPLEQESKTNIEETYQKIGWKAETGLAQGLEKMIESFRHQ